MTKNECRALQQSVDDDMAELGMLLHVAFLVARRLEDRGVKMASLDCSATQIRHLRDAVEDAYATNKASVPQY